jgi:hypothetical protein
MNRNSLFTTSTKALLTFAAITRVALHSVGATVPHFPEARFGITSGLATIRQQSACKPIDEILSAGRAEELQRPLDKNWENC